MPRRNRTGRYYGGGGAGGFITFIPDPPHPRHIRHRLKDGRVVHSLGGPRFALAHGSASAAAAASPAPRSTSSTSSVSGWRDPACFELNHPACPGVRCACRCHLQKAEAAA
jgi:hypothetical protein